MSHDDALATEGDNHRLILTDGIVRGAIWKRPDLDNAQGAANAQQIEHALLGWLSRRPQGLFLDVSEGPEVAGPKTEATIAAWFEAYANAKIPVAVQVGASAMQRMQYQRLLHEKLGPRGRLCAGLDEALAFLKQPA